MQENMKLRSISNESMVGKVVLLHKSYFGNAAYVKSQGGIDKVDRRFKVSGGFGAEPGKIGRAVFGTFLSDGEEARVDRGDIEGIID